MTGDEIATCAETFRRDGCVILRAILPDCALLHLRDICARVKDRWLIRDPLTGRPGGIPGVETCMRHVNHPSYFLDSREELADVLEACVNPTCISFLSAVW